MFVLRVNSHLLLSQVIQFYGHELVSVRILIAAMLVPLTLICWVPNLKYLAPFSMLANFLMGTGLAITMYYLVTDVPDIKERNQATSITNLPMFINIVIFALTTFGVVSGRWSSYLIS